MSTRAVVCLLLAGAAAVVPVHAQVGIRPAAADSIASQGSASLPDAVPAEATVAALPVPASGLRLARLGAAMLDAPADRAGAAVERGEPGRLDARTLARRNTLAIGAGIAGIAAYGFAKWWDQGFDRRADFEREGWFGRGTRYGGIDKLGHAYSNYVGVRLLAPLLEALGNDPVAARRLAFWSTLGTFAGIEVLDAYSRQYRASWEDFAFNVAGSVAALALLGHPQADRLIDLRLGYRRSRNSDWDPGSDYEGQVYLLVLKGEGMRGLRDHAIGRYLEFSVGYAARGFDLPAGVSGDRRRELQVGIGLNLSRVLADVAYGGQRGSTPVQRAADFAFELVQFPTRAHGRVALD